MDELNNRINQLIDDKKLTKSAFAAKLDVSLPMITHITTGRNKPGIEIIQRILTCFSEVNPNWLLLGKEFMYKQEIKPAEPSKLQTIINQLRSELVVLQKTNSTTLDYHKLMRDEVVHLLELDKEIALANNHLSKIDNWLSQLLNEEGEIENA